MELKQFTPTPNATASILIIGKRATGKTTLAQHLIKTICKGQEGIAIDPRSGYHHNTTSSYEDIIEKNNVHVNYDTQVVANMIARQAKTRQASFLVMDNCLWDNSWHNDKNIRSLFCCNKNLHTTFILTMSYPLMIPPELRSNIDYVFLFRDTYKNNIKRVYDQYGGMFETFEQFKDVFERATSNPYNALVLDNAARTSNIEDQVFVYSVPQKDSDDEYICFGCGEKIGHTNEEAQKHSCS